MIHKAILSADCPESIDELFKVKIGSKMLTVVEKINEKMVQQKVQNKKVVEVEDNEPAKSTEDQPDLLKQAIEQVFQQYQNCFDKAKIFEIKKVQGLTK